MPHIRLSIANGTSYIESSVEPDIRVRVLFLENPEVAGAGAGDSGINRPEENYAKTVFHWDSGPRREVEIVVKNLRMSIDGIDFGDVEPGDHVVIDARTKERSVTVNGVNRNPVAGAR